jgi:pimeloyl-ACP methyl ester carboxylesterase
MMEEIAGMAGVLEGSSDRRAPLVLLHGLTFDSRVWGPALAALRRIDSERQVLLLDLPGHGGSPGWPSYDLESVAAAVHGAIRQAGLRDPVVVGHSIAARYEAAGVVNVDQWLQVEPAAAIAQPLASEIRGGGFASAWDQFEVSMHMELLPVDAQLLLRLSRCLRQDLVAGYWRQLLDTPVPELARYVCAAVDAVRGAGIPYLFVAGHEVEPRYRGWLNQMLPQASVRVWPGSGHFPHLAHPGRFARCLAATGDWEVRRDRVHG